MYSVSGTCKLGNDIRLDVRKYANYSELVFQERVFEGRLMKPTVNEFGLPLRRWNQLVSNLEELERTISEHKNGRDVHFELHLGGNNYVNVNSGFEIVSLREYSMSEGGNHLQPTRIGIALKFEEFERLASLVPEIERLAPELTTIQPCYMDADHANLLGALYCFECNPNYIL
jgi:hypothetical protein